MARGASSRSGPPPDPNALRRERGDDSGWMTLPAGGREGKVPSWPLSKASSREATLWRREWRRPQAVMWERNGQELEVALYVRSLAMAEQMDASVASRTLVRQQQEALGLSVPGLARNRWRIEHIEASSPRPARRPGRSSVRDRLRVVTGDAAD